MCRVDGMQILGAAVTCVMNNCSGTAAAISRVGVLCDPRISSAFASILTPNPNPNPDPTTAPGGSGSGDSGANDDEDTPTTTTSSSQGASTPGSGSGGTASDVVEDGNDGASDQGDKEKGQDSDSVDQTAPQDGSSSGSSGGLSSGAKAGIAVGVIVGVALILGLLYLVWRHGKRLGTKQSQSLGGTSSSTFTGGVGGGGTAPGSVTPMEYYKPPTAGPQELHGVVAQLQPPPAAAQQLYGHAQTYGGYDHQGQHVAPEIGGRQSPGLQEAHGDTARYELGGHRPERTPQELPGTR